MGWASLYFFPLWPPTNPVDKEKGKKHFPQNSKSSFPPT